MNGFALAALVAGVFTVNNFEIAIEPDPHPRAKECTSAIDDREVFTHQAQYFCIMSKKLPFDTVSCFMESVKVRRRA